MKFYAISDIGRVREINEDSYLAKEYDGTAIFAVFDGMGGANAGEDASAMARDELERYFDNFFAENDSFEPATIQAALASAADSANFKVYSLSQEKEELSGMGTTLVSALIVSKKIYIANVGDSRAYLIDQNGAIQLTRDHSFVQYLVDVGRITPEEARTNPKKNIITRAIGVDKEVSVDVSVLEKKEYENKTMLLCSDGLTNYIDPIELTNLCNKHQDAEEFAKALVDAANNAGGNDNITAIVIKL